MKKPTDYTKGLIYKIYCNDETITDVYIGSTVDFKSRRRAHKCRCCNEKNREYNYYRYKFIRDNGGWDNWTMIELYKYPCANKRELEQEEDRMMIELKSTLNKKRACRNLTEYRYDNREMIKKKNDEYYAKNKETMNKKTAEYRFKNKETLAIKRKEKMKCINCGCMINRNNISTHMKSNKCISHNKPPIEIKI
jgi:hypothetical protein